MGNGVFSTVCHKWLEKEMVTWKQSGRFSEFFFVILLEYCFVVNQNCFIVFQKFTMKLRRIIKSANNNWKSVFFGYRPPTVPHVWKMKCYSISHVNMHLIHHQKYWWYCPLFRILSIMKENLECHNMIFGENWLRWVYYLRYFKKQRFKIIMVFLSG